MRNLIALILTVAAITVSAADNKPAPKSWIESISIAPVGAIKTAHLDGPSQWGAGLDLAAHVNPFVSVHVVNLSYEGVGESTTTSKKPGFSVTSGEEKWGGLLVDETMLQVDAKISRFSTEAFSLHLVGGGQTDWNDNDYGVNVGGRLALDFNKHFGVSAGYSIRTWFKGETRVDSLATAQVNISF